MNKRTLCLFVLCYEEITALQYYSLCLFNSETKAVDNAELNFIFWPQIEKIKNITELCNFCFGELLYLYLSKYRSLHHFSVAFRTLVWLNIRKD